MLPHQIMIYFIITAFHGAVGCPECKTVVQHTIEHTTGNGSDGSGEPYGKPDQSEKGEAGKHVEDARRLRREAATQECVE